MTPRKYSPSDSLKQFYIPVSKGIIIKGNIPLIRISQIAKNNTNFLLSYFFFWSILKNNKRKKREWWIL